VLPGALSGARLPASAIEWPEESQETASVLSHWQLESCKLRFTGTAPLSESSSPPGRVQSLTLVSGHWQPEPQTLVRRTAPNARRAAGRALLPLRSDSSREKGASLRLLRWMLGRPVTTVIGSQGRRCLIVVNDVVAVEDGPDAILVRNPLPARNSMPRPTTSCGAAVHVRCT
jgi:hypothetical protein